MSGRMPEGRTEAEANANANAEESLLAELLARLTDELRRGLAPDVDDLARRHPTLADELRDLWAAAWIAEEVARSSGDLEATVGWEPSPRPMGNPDFTPGPRF